MYARGLGATSSGRERTELYLSQTFNMDGDTLSIDRIYVRSIQTEAYGDIGVSIDGVEYVDYSWGSSSSYSGTYSGTWDIDINSLSGSHELEFYVRAADDTDDAYVTLYIDNICIDDVSEPVEYISRDQSTYSSGDIAQINFTYPSYNPSYENYINVRSHNPVSSSWELEEMYFVYAESGSVNYLVPVYTSRQFRA